MTYRSTVSDPPTSETARPPDPREERSRVGDLEEDLVRRAREGEREAFRRVYDRYAAMVHGILISCAPPGEAQDLVQEVFLKALRRIGDLREPGKIGSWLASIARNTGRDALRQVRPTAPLPDEIPDRSHDGEVEAREVLDCIRSLPGSYRETLALRLVEGMTGREIAYRTGMTEGSVRVNLHRGMKMLRERMERRGMA